jgi:hypothetical protein
MTQPTPGPVDLDPNASYTDIINSYLAQWGLQDLAPLVTQLGQSGASNDQISLQLQQSPEYQQRFAGNQQRIAKGLAPLSPAAYIALESQYGQILSQLPAGFYDSREALANFIGNDVSASELSQRVQDANQAWVNAPQERRDAWNAYYGGAGPGGAVAAILDPKAAEPLLQQQVAAAGIGGAALSQGLQLTSQATATRAAQQGVTIQQAQNAYQQIAQRMNVDQAVSGRFGEQFGQAQEEQANLLGDAGAQNQQARLYSEEQAQFGGHGGARANGESNNPGANY